MHRSAGARRAISALVANTQAQAKPRQGLSVSPVHKPYKQVSANL